ncbi:hypothetical protein EYF80_031257 [Liparis tanakae]|uniref:Uncharacterized protein n=1 Tax=Liparis tanakae TaxID=230148 RepID=A0A4Z2GZK9_9TELE|nr:hypothetical protein EYF80_031257 [Liparis tanakae]
MTSRGRSSSRRSNRSTSSPTRPFLASHWFITQSSSVYLWYLYSGSGPDSPKRVQSMSDSPSMTRQNSHRTAGGSWNRNVALCCPADMFDGTRRHLKLTAND